MRDIRQRVKGEARREAQQTEINCVRLHEAACQDRDKKETDKMSSDVYKMVRNVDESLHVSRSFPHWRRNVFPVTGHRERHLEEDLSRWASNEWMELCSVSHDQTDYWWGSSVLHWLLISPTTEARTLPHSYNTTGVKFVMQRPSAHLTLSSLEGEPCLLLVTMMLCMYVATVGPMTNDHRDQYNYSANANDR